MVFPEQAAEQVVDMVVGILFNQDQFLQNHPTLLFELHRVDLGVKHQIR